MSLEYAVSQLEQWTVSTSLLLDQNVIQSYFENGLCLQPMPSKKMIEPELTECNRPKVGQQGKVYIISPGKSEHSSDHS
jgi:hypothetical protein